MTLSLAKILLVEDDDIDIAAFERAVKKSKLKNPLYKAYNGEEALKILKGNGDSPLERPYVIVLDINMPVMDGFEFLKFIRSDQKLKETLIFVLTTSRAEEDKKKAYGFNVAGFITKDEDNNSLLKIVELLGNYSENVELP